MDKPNDAQLPRQRARTKGREDFFPTSLYEYDGSGITKKEWMATQLLAGMLPLGGPLASYEEDSLVEAAVNLATKLLIRLVETDGIDLLPPGEPVFIPSDLDAADMGDEEEDDAPDFDERDTEDLGDTDEISF